jgi:hypothetical protein
MPNNDHLNDNNGNGGLNGRFAGGTNKPGGRHVEEDGSEGPDHLKGRPASTSLLADSNHDAFSFIIDGGA